MKPTTEWQNIQEYLSPPYPESINNYPVKEENQKKVEEAIKELNCKLNYLARSLIGKSTHTIGSFQYHQSILSRCRKA